jgi:sugar phosphate isomerase/epimerase
MKVGMLTAPFEKESLETVIGFAETSDITCLEVVAHPGSRHVDPGTLTAAKAAKIKEQVGEAGLQISSLAYYTNTCDPKTQKAVLAHAKKTIDAAALLDVPVVCLLAGMPVGGMSKIETIQKVLPKVFRPILDHAAKKGVKIALENYFET